MQIKDNKDTLSSSSETSYTPNIHLLNFLFDNRWLLGSMLLIVCVALQLHGSSIGLYADLLGHPELNDVLLGKNRPVRSDEWIVFTPFAFSQYYTNFSLMSDIVRGTATNMFITFGQAVYDIAMIYRPAQWGYFFLSPGGGLAFYWMGRWIILFLVSFEFAWQILTRDKAISLCYAALIAFSPLVQWWFSINSIVEILAAGQGIVVLWKLYLAQDEKKYRLIYGIAILWCMGVYILGVYPAWQVSFGYVFLFLLIWVSWKNHQHLHKLREDVLLWGLGFCLMLAPIIHIISASWDMIQITKATAYPGARFELGGDWLGFLPASAWSFLYSASLFLPFKDSPIANNSEIANFFSLSPLGIILFLYLSYKKKTDYLMLLLTILMSLLSIWAFWGTPAFLAKLSLLSNVTVKRGKTATDFINILLLCRGAYLIKAHNLLPSKALRIGIAFFTAFLATLCLWQAIPAWCSLKNIAIATTTIIVFSYIFLSAIHHKGTIALLILMFVIGATVNPLAKGTDSIYAQPLGQKIAEISAKDKSLWIDTVGLQNFPIMFGAPTINSVNVYPALSRWEGLDGGENFQVYNRYAHISMRLIEQTKNLSFTLKQPDLFEVQLRPSDLEKLKVKYILSREELEKLSTPSVHIKELFNNQGFRIYVVDYQM